MLEMASARDDQGVAHYIEFVLDSGKRVRGHQAWMMARCDLINAMLGCGMQEGRTRVVPVRDCSDGAFMALLSFLYTGKLDAKACLGQDEGELFMLADFFGMEAMALALRNGKQDCQLPEGNPWFTRTEVEPATTFGGWRRIILLGEMECERMEQMPESLEGTGIKMLEAAIQGDKLTDMEFVLDSGKRVRGHQTWMMARCEYIREFIKESKSWIQFTQQGRTRIVTADGRYCTRMITMSVEDCSDRAFMALLAFLYTGRLDANACFGQDGRELWHLADLFRVEGMAHALRQGVTFDRLEEIAALAAAVGDFQLMEECAHVMGMEPLSVAAARSVASAMGLLARCESVQSVGCAFLIKFTEKRSKRTHKQPGYVAAVVGGMLAGESCLGLQDCGFTTLEFMLREESIRCPGVHAASIMDAGGVKAIVVAMALYLQNAKMQRKGCDLLRLLCNSSAEHRCAVVEEGGVGCVIGAMQAHCGDTNLQNSALRLISEVCADDDDIRNAITRVGGVSCVLEAMGVHKTQSIIQLNGCKAIVNLCSGNLDTRRLIAKHGGRPLDFVLYAMNTYRQNSDITSNGCVAVGLLCPMRTTSHSTRCASQRGDAPPFAVTAADGECIGCVLVAMKGNEDMAEVQSNGCWAIGQLCDGHAENRSATAKRGGIECVCAAMKLFPDHEGVQRNGCRAIGQLCVDNVMNQDAFATKGGIGFVLEAMEAMRNIVLVQSYGCWAIEQLCKDRPATRHAVAQEGGIGCVLEAMVTQNDSADVQLNGCSAVMQLCIGNPLNQRAVAEKGGIDCLLAAIECHTNDAFVLSFACVAVLQLCADNPNIWNAVSELGGVDCVLMAMTAHPDDAYVQSNGCWTLAELCNGCAENRLGIAEAGGVDCVLAALTAHPDDVSVQFNGCKAIAELCNDHAENRVSIAEVGGINCVLAALTAHPDDIFVQSSGCRAIGELCKGNFENGITVGKAGGIDCVIAGIQIQKPAVNVQADFQSPQVPVDKSQCVGPPPRLRVSKGSEGHQPMIRSSVRTGCPSKQEPGDSFDENPELSGDISVSGAIADREEETAEAVTKEYNAVTPNVSIALDPSLDPSEEPGPETRVDLSLYYLSGGDEKDHASSHQSNGCWALGQICYRSPQNRRSAVEKGGVFCLLSTMVLNLDSCMVQRYGCWALTQLCADDDQSKRTIVEGGGISCVLSAMKRYSDDGGLQKNCCGLIAELCDDNAENRADIVAGDGIIRVLDAMCTHPHDGVQRYGCWALAELCTGSPGIQRAIAEEGGIDCVLWAMQAYLDNVDLQSRGCLAIMRLWEGIPGIMHVVCEAGAVQAVEAAMKAHPSELVLCMRGVGALKALGIGWHWGWKVSDVKSVSSSEIEVGLSEIQIALSKVEAQIENTTSDCTGRVEKDPDWMTAASKVVVHKTEGREKFKVATFRDVLMREG
jgi:hypothetical protein